MKLKYHLCDIILTGGKAVATIDDVVRVSGVSRSTVFRFLNGSNVRPEARKAILQAMEQLNYKSDAVYRQQNITIEISTASNYDSFKGFTEVVQGIMERAAEKGVTVNLVRRNGEQITADYSGWSTRNGLKGIIVVGKNKEDEQKEAEIFLTKKIPHVFVNRVIDNPNISYVAVDLKKAAYDMVSYLIGNGHREIAVLGNPKTFKVDRDKLDGYKNAFLDNGIKVSEKYYFEIDKPEDWETQVRSMFEKGDVPTAYFGICDSYAMKFINLVHSLGYKVPEDIAVVGMDDIEAASYFKPAITSVHVPFRKMGITAVDNLLQLITDDDVSSMKTIIKHDLVIRESCRNGRA